jgi:hypothetical protein
MIQRSIDVHIQRARGASFNMIKRMAEEEFQKLSDKENDALNGIAELIRWSPKKVGWVQLQLCWLETWLSQFRREQLIDAGCLLRGSGPIRLKPPVLGENPAIPQVEGVVTGREGLLRPHRSWPPYLERVGADLVWTPKAPEMPKSCYRPQRERLSCF